MNQATGALRGLSAGTLCGAGLYLALSRYAWGLTTKSREDLAKASAMLENPRGKNGRGRKEEGGKKFTFFWLEVDQFFFFLLVSYMLCINLLTTWLYPLSHGYLLKDKTICLTPLFLSLSHTLCYFLFVSRFHLGYVIFIRGPKHYHPHFNIYIYIYTCL